MSDTIDIVDVNDQKLDRELMDLITNATDGPMPKVAAAGQSVIRRRLRESSFTRRIIPHVKVENSDLTYALDTERPIIVEEMEPESPAAVSLSFNAHPDTAFYRRDKFVVYFSKISTPEFTKNTDELRVGRSNLRQIITDNSLRDIDYEEDSRFIQYVDRICGTPEGVGASGEQQFHTTPATIERDTYVDSTNWLEDAWLNNGVFLANRRTANEFVKFGRDEAGGDLSERLLLRGRKALEGGVVCDVPHIITIKRDLVPFNMVYQFTEPGYLGRAYILDNVTMYVEKKKDILRFSAVEKLGITIANVAGCQIQQFGVSEDT